MWALCLVALLLTSSAAGIEAAKKKKTKKKASTKKNNKKKGSKASPPPMMATSTSSPPPKDNDDDDDNNEGVASLTASPPPPGELNPSNCPEGVDYTLLIHNADRAKHVGTEPLVWDSALRNSSKAWVDKLLGDDVCAKGTISTSGTPGVGENVWMGWFSSTGTPFPPAVLPYNCSYVMDYWYGKVKNYKFTSTPWTDNMAGFSSQGIGIFSQMVWASTKRLGCYWGQSVSSGTVCMVAVCHYSPQGNIASDSYFLDNVKSLVAS